MIALINLSGEKKSKKSKNILTQKLKYNHGASDTLVNSSQ